MSCVKLEDLKHQYPYVKLHVNDKDKVIQEELESLFTYINDHVGKEYTSIYKNGKAFKAIRETANRITGRNDIKIRKREVASLIRIYVKKFPLSNHGEYYIKIPYKLDYIFRAIFEIVSRIEMENPLPKDLEVVLGKIRRDVFYLKQSQLYETDIKNFMNKKEYDENKIYKALYNDIFTMNASLSQKF